MPTPEYSSDWSEISLQVRESSNWICQCCGRKCYRPGERPAHLNRSEWTANTLQVHHRDYNPSNNNLSNLLSVCPACHLQIHQSKYSSVSPGQLSLFQT